jgi:hypothetical protein
MMRFRLAHHNIDLGRAWPLHGDHTKAWPALNIARRTAPQQTRYHPMVAETIADSHPLNLMQPDAEIFGG